MPSIKIDGQVWDETNFVLRPVNGYNVTIMSDDKTVVLPLSVETVAEAKFKVGDEIEWCAELTDNSKVGSKGTITSITEIR